MWLQDGYITHLINQHGILLINQEFCNTNINGLLFQGRQFAIIHNKSKYQCQD